MMDDLLSRLTTPALLKLSIVGFEPRGRTVRFVGGCVRDAMLGLTPKDIDLQTDATPDEQIEIYKALGLDYFLTGVEYGTITVRLDDGETYEVTSYRKDVATDGRRATVAYTRDLAEDLARRDLTINAMSLGFGGDLVDPFGGQDDLIQGRVRFVGKPFDRMVEDGLRILRFLRFHVRFGKGDLDADALKAMSFARGALRHVSVERIWWEIAKLVVLDKGPALLEEVLEMGLPVGLPLPYKAPGKPASIGHLRECMETVQAHSRNPVTLMTAGFGYSVRGIAETLKWSRAERDLADFLCARDREAGGLDAYKWLLAGEGCRRDWVYELMIIKGEPELIEDLRQWPVPTFPVTGADLIASGMAPGPAMGERLFFLRRHWGRSHYTADKADLLKVTL